MAFSGSQITRQGLSGITRGLYGSFAGKTGFVQPTVTLNTDTRYEVYIRRHNNTFEHTEIVFTGTDFGLVD